MVRTRSSRATKALPEETNQTTKVSKKKTVAAANLIEALPAKEEPPVTTLSVRNSPAVADELELYDFDGRDEAGRLLDKQTQELLRESTLVIKRALRTQITSVVVIGRELIKVKKAIKDRTYMKWFSATLSEFFSLDTAENYVNAAKLSEQYSLAQLESMPLNALYVLGRSTVERELQAYVIEDLAPAAQLEGNTLTKKDVQKVIKDYRRLQLNTSNISDKARPLLLTSPVAEDREELQRLSRLSVKRQIEVAKILKDNPNADVKQALSILRETSQEPIEEEPLDAEIISVHNKLETRRGEWFKLLQETETESVDLCFAEMPLSREALSDYQLLAQEMDRILKPGGLLLSVVSQPNIQFVGTYLEPLNVLWTFMLMRRPGHSPRIVGRISFASSYIPLSLAYKSPLRAIPGLVDDVRTGIPDDIMKFHFKAAGEDEPNKEEAFSLSSIESSIEYYVKSLMQNGDVFMHLIHNRDSSFKINDHLYDYAFNQAASKIISLIGT